MAIVVLQLLFPVGRLFSIAFANLIAVYAAIFSLFVEEVFKGVDPDILSIAFSLREGDTLTALKQRSGRASVMQSNGNVPVMSQSITRK